METNMAGTAQTLMRTEEQVSMQNPELDQSMHLYSP